MGDQNRDSGSSNAGGIAAAVVVGAVGVSALIYGLYKLFEDSDDDEEQTSRQERRQAQERSRQEARRTEQEKDRQEELRKEEEKIRQEALRKEQEKIRQEALRKEQEKIRQEELRKEEEKIRQEALRKEEEKIRQEALRKEEEKIRQEALRKEQEKIRQEALRKEQEKIRQEALRKEEEKIRQEALRKEEEKAKQEASKSQADRHSRQESNEEVNELVEQGRRLLQEGWEAERVFQAEEAGHKFESARAKFEQASKLDVGKSSWLAVSEMKIKGNRLFNEGLAFQQRGNASGESKGFFKNALVKFAEAKEAFEKGWLLSKDEGFKDCIALVDGSIELAQGMVSLEDREVTVSQESGLRLEHEEQCDLLASIEMKPL